MKIWQRQPTVDELNQFSQNTLGSHLGIEMLEIGDDFISARMPVDERTVQPFGILHGGASVALAETLGSVAGTLCIDTDRNIIVGLEINANHVRAVPLVPSQHRWVVGTTRPVHLGGLTQVWQTHIRDEQERLVCLSRLTIAVLDKR